MRLDLLRLREQFGSVLYYGLQSIYELDSGMIPDDRQPQQGATTQHIPYKKLNAVLNNMAIIVPMKDEKLNLLDGVLAGIPHGCRIIVVSNSSRAPIDRFQLEKDIVETFGAYTNRKIICIHQKNLQIARAFEAAGYTDILDDKGLVRNGKAEGMIMGAMMAYLMGSKTVGFIDSDNYFPGAVLEYCHLYAAGFAMSRKLTNSMVRISWNSKPKIVESSLYFAKWGRSSIVTNQYLNKLVSHYTGFETEVIRTGNAGEHALSIDLALNIGWSAGYSVEPYQLMYVMEQFGDVLEANRPDVMRDPINVYQLESRNPHLHESKGEEHVHKMIEASLSVIYHSPLCPEKIKEAIRFELDKRGIRLAGEEIPMLRQYPPLATADLEAFRSYLRSYPFDFDFVITKKPKPALLEAK